jgi:hypothetical protein
MGSDRLWLVRRTHHHMAKEPTGRLGYWPEPSTRIPCEPSADRSPEDLGRTRCCTNSSATSTANLDPASSGSQRAATFSSSTANQQSRACWQYSCRRNVGVSTRAASYECIVGRPGSRTRQRERFRTSSGCSGRIKWFRTQQQQYHHHGQQCPVHRVASRSTHTICHVEPLDRRICPSTISAKPEPPAIRKWQRPRRPILLSCCTAAAPPCPSSKRPLPCGSSRPATTLPTLSAPWPRSSPGPSCSAGWCCTERCPNCACGPCCPCQRRSGDIYAVEDLQVAV